jgi:hypothetical protein
MAGLRLRSTLAAPLRRPGSALRRAVAQPVIIGRHTVSDRVLHLHTPTDRLLAQHSVSERALRTHTVSDLAGVV